MSKKLHFLTNGSQQLEIWAVLGILMFRISTCCTQTSTLISSLACFFCTRSACRCSLRFELIEGTFADLKDDHLGGPPNQVTVTTSLSGSSHIPTIPLCQGGGSFSIIISSGLQKVLICWRMQAFAVGIPRPKGPDT